ncbi:DUF3995 domain-containing protein [Neobacillus sp. LXY-1]|uniref:DUF3995 domain-containing protein n=1 Tax=Neobacillus sp. LXY-1 TaxID=3379133 RepID=UPI003EDF2C84
MVGLMIAGSAILLIGIGCLHVYWAFGGSWGSNHIIPKSAKLEHPIFAPGKFVTLFVSFLLFLAAGLLILQGGLFKFVYPNILVNAGCWACMIVFGLRVVGDFKYFGLFKKVRHTLFSCYDTYLFMPICAWFCFIFYVAIQIGR